MSQRRRAGLQRLFSAIVVRDPRDRQRALRREGRARMRRSICSGRSLAADRPAPARCSTRCSRSRATRSPCSVSARSGLSALMAAKIAGCDPIIAVDIHAQRLALARELGATHAIDHTGRSRRRARDPKRSPATACAFRSKRRRNPPFCARPSTLLMPGGTCVLLGQRAQRNRGLPRDAVPAVRPHGPRRHPGREPAAGIHSDSSSTF